LGRDIGDKRRTDVAYIDASLFTGTRFPLSVFELFEKFTKAPWQRRSTVRFVFALKLSLYFAQE
jgi:hypothetical protein